MNTNLFWLKVNIFWYLMNSYICNILASITAVWENNSSDKDIEDGKFDNFLTLICVKFLRVRFKVWWLEEWLKSFALSASIWNTFFIKPGPKISFFPPQKISIFDRNSNFIQAIVWNSCSTFLVFVKLKVVVNESLGMMNTGIQLLVCSKSTINFKNDNDVIISQHDVYRSGILNSNLVFKFHDNIVTGFEVMTVFVYKEFDQKSVNWKDPILVFVLYLETGVSQGNEILINVSNKNLSNFTKWLVYTLYYLTLFSLCYLGKLYHIGGKW